jgi:rhodanese-related sulfurtransferase
MGKTASEMVAEAKARVENLDPMAVAEEIRRGAVLVDLREQHELNDKGHIAGSVHIPRGMLEFLADPTNPNHQKVLDPRKRVILYCATGNRSPLAAATLQDLGYAHVAHLAGGIAAWTEQGLPVDKSRQELCMISC